MAKKNENTQKKINKWEAAPKSIKDLYFAIGGVFDGLSSIIDPEEADNEDKALIDLLARVLDDYNELEAKHQKECGMISEYEEELSVRKEENKQIKADLENQVAITEEIRELRDDLNKILEHSNCGYGLNKPESLESLKKFLKDEYKFDVTFIRTSPDEGFWKLIQRGPNVFNRKSNNFRWAFRGAMECLGMSPGAIVAEIIWASNPKVTPTDIAAKWSQRVCEKFETKAMANTESLKFISLKEERIQMLETETEIKSVVLDILDHSKPNSCERCRHYNGCMDGVFKEAVHECCNHYGNHCGAEWDKEAELDRIDRVIAEDIC